jgi:hypothetical protein
VRSQCDSSGRAASPKPPDSTSASEKRLPTRSSLPHDPPSWIREDSIFFITICTVPRWWNQLCRKSVARALRESIEFREESGHWLVPLCLLMPDHLHMLMSFAPGVGLRREIFSITGFAPTNRLHSRLSMFVRIQCAPD